MATRRDTLKILVSGVAVTLLQGEQVMADEKSATAPTTAPDNRTAAAYRGAHKVKPLPFDPEKLNGLSAKLLISHHDNNYAGAVKRLNQIQQQLGSLPGDAPPYQLGSLKREELIAANSMILHELYFGNLGGTATASGLIAEMLDAEYGSVDAWSREFRRGCLSLGGGSGWMVLSHDPHSGSVHSYWSADHTDNLAGGTPLLVMDMYEHAYHMDYGANAQAYVDAFFQNVNWSEVNRRAQKARGAGIWEG